MKYIFRAFALAAFIYAGILLYFIVFQESLLFHPSNQSFDDCEDILALGGKAHHDSDLRYYELKRPNAVGTLVYFHGNSGSSCGRAARVQMLSQELNLNVLVPEYPGFSNDLNHKPTQKAILTNMSKFMERIVSNRPGPIFSIGVSLGSGVANYLATKYPQAGLILISPYTSISEVGAERYPYVPIKLLNRNPFPSRDWAKQVTIPVIIFHGTKDRVIPFHHGEALARAFKGAEFYEIKGAHHHNMFSDYLPEVLPPMKQFIFGHILSANK